jgi:hypothetical protein
MRKKLYLDADQRPIPIPRPDLERTLDSIMRFITRRYNLRSL